MKTINVSTETYELIKDQLKDEEAIDISSINDLIGKKFYIRTVTYHLTGRVVKIVGKMLLLENAAWIADSGRFQQAIDDGVLSEVEPVKVNPLVNMDSITDMFPWVHELPNKQK